jgi:hypothetical protein
MLGFAVQGVGLRTLRSFGLLLGGVASRPPHQRYVAEVCRHMVFLQLIYCPFVCLLPLLRHSISGAEVAIAQI